MDAAVGRVPAGAGHDHGLGHQLSLLPRTRRRRNLLLPQTAACHGRGRRGLDRLLDGAVHALSSAGLSAFGRYVCRPHPRFGSGHRREPRRRAALDHARWLRFSAVRVGKAAMIFYLAHSMAKKEQTIRTFSVGVLPHLMVSGAFAGVLLLEPDFGSALIMTMLLYFMLFVGGARVHHLLATGLMALPLLVYVMTKAEYRVRRLMTFLDPWSDAAGSGFHVIQSLIAFGSGQLWGRGLGESRQKLFYLPEAHTDFVYSVVGEELGLLGAWVVLALFGVIITRGFRLTAKIEEPFEQYLAFGVTVLLGAQALIHMGVVMGLMPTKGLVLPFISYGGSAMVINLMAAGILLGLSRRRL